MELLTDLTNLIHLTNLTWPSYLDLHACKCNQLLDRTTGYELQGCITLIIPIIPISNQVVVTGKW